jgi:hypothetical protein
MSTRSDDDCRESSLKPIEPGIRIDLAACVTYA